ncbi:MAG: glutamine-hydrolyzing carbamoyl-phosphate synthase small subunit [Desulfoplanes sp.]|nr:glutamine-hydrolyzing carbamoyl-phosphate synthase small subunit [Desulfoplanes sp.]
MYAILALEDGTWFECSSFTGPGETGGEVIFNTGMTGYQEILTDPSYRGQMVCMTYPLIGNYGINLEDVESDRVQAAALICKECCKHPSNWRSHQSLPQYLKEHNVMGIEDLDTRALTKHLRIHGAMRGIISTQETDPKALTAHALKIPSMEGSNLVQEVAPKEPYLWANGRPQRMEPASSKTAWVGKGPKVIVYDFGIKWNILRLLAAQGLDMIIVPPSFTAAQVDELQPDGIFLSNGPGDPAVLTQTIATVAKLCNTYPTAGICLGHQILGLALGGTSFKLKFGHHGCNHPVKDLTTGKIEISSQNHGFCVDITGIPFLETTHINLNDQTLEGFRHTGKPIMAVQYHPESAPGPHDSRYFFKRFTRMITNAG